LGVDEARVRAVLKAIVRRGAVHEVARDHFFLQATVAEMAGLLARLGNGGAYFSAAPFRDLLGEGAWNAGRKVAIQVLEFFDRHGVTLRRGDLRCVDQRRILLFVRAEAV
jgi:selenocysteine-specific elongation factor